MNLPCVSMMADAEILKERLKPCSMSTLVSAAFGESEEMNGVALVTASHENAKVGASLSPVPASLYRSQIARSWTADSGSLTDIANCTRILGIEKPTEV